MNPGSPPPSLHPTRRHLNNVDKNHDKARFFFEHYGLTERDLEHYLAAALSAGGDYADLYFEYLSSTSLMVDESMVKSASQGISAGCGIRVVSGERTGYAYTDDLSADRILHAARTAALIASAPAKTPVAGFQENPPPAAFIPSHCRRSMPKSPPRSNSSCVPTKPPAPTIRAFKKSAPATATNSATFWSSPPTALSPKIPAARPHERDLHREDGKQLCPRHLPAAEAASPSTFSSARRTPEFFAKESARQAILQLDAREAPAGEMEVVLGPGWPGVLLHEAVGHGLEADFNRKKTSAFAGLIGKRVASEKCTVVDNGTMPWRRGSLNVDDEGNSTQETVLIEKGILKGYLSDKLSARLMGMANTGNGRRESYEHIPMPRMTNTYMLAGTGQSRGHHPLGEARSLCRQLRRRPGRHHQRKIRLLRQRSLHDRRRPDHRANQRRHADRQRPRCLNARIMVGNDLKLDEGVGTCGKDGQAVPVGVGIPTLKIDRLTVGGTAKKRSRRLHAVKNRFHARQITDTGAKRIRARLASRRVKSPCTLGFLSDGRVRLRSCRISRANASCHEVRTAHGDRMPDTRNAALKSSCRISRNDPANSNPKLK